jgi:hypothetical protein
VLENRVLLDGHPVSDVCVLCAAYLDIGSRASDAHALAFSRLSKSWYTRARVTPSTRAASTALRP